MRIIIAFLFLTDFTFGQGYNHQWLLGNNPFVAFPNGRAYFDTNSVSFVSEFRKMSFKGTQANISDINGNLLMSSNGIWIADATGDTMVNGSGLNPSPFTSNWPYGFPVNHMNIILPFPDDSTKFLLIHKTLWASFSPALTGVYETLIDISLNSGNGAVVTKNDTILSDTLSWGIGACRHANGRDWWVLVSKDNNPIFYTMLITPNGIDTIFTQALNFTADRLGNVSPIVFSEDGTKIIYCTSIDQGPGGNVQNGTVLICDFNRCTGMIGQFNSFSVSDNAYLYGLSFSPSGKYVYACSSNYIFQIDTDAQTVDTVATYDGFISPPGSGCCATTFWGMYLAANGKIYITSGSSVQHLHEINYPDSAGITCDVQQHAVDLVDYLHLRSIPNHPNYYLGCDTTLGCACLTTGTSEITSHDFMFTVFPNPSSGDFKITYMLPQNESGKLEIFDVNGRRVYEQNLPQWSTMQYIALPSEITAGIYSSVISSAKVRKNRKLVIIK